MPISIDVVAHHEMQLQSCEAVASELRKKYPCNILVGQNAKPTGAQVVILVDHPAFQPRVSKGNYQYLIHMSHDLADFNTYADEREGLKDIDLFLVPGEKHFRTASTTFPGAHVHQIGWPKFELDLVGAEDPKRYRSSRPDQRVILYAPTHLHTREWEEVLPALLQTGHLVLIKNHVYYNFEAGEPPPWGCEDTHTRSIKSLLDMEAWLRSGNYENHVYVDRRSNICALFKYADILVTDSSSCGIEFLPFGACIETGRFGPSKTDIEPYAARFTDAVLYAPVDVLLGKLAIAGWVNDVAELHKGGDKKGAAQFIYEPPLPSSKYAAELIDAHLFLWQNWPRVEGSDFSKNTKMFSKKPLAIKNRIENILRLR